MTHVAVFTANLGLDRRKVAATVIAYIKVEVFLVRRATNIKMKRMRISSPQKSPPPLAVSSEIP